MRSQRLKADICFVHVVLCQDAAIFYESKTAFLARTPQAARCQEKTFFLVPVYMQVKRLSQEKHMRSFFPAEPATARGGRPRRWEGRRQVLAPAADPRHSSFCSKKDLPGLCVPEHTPTRGAHKLEGT